MKAEIHRILLEGGCMALKPFGFFAEGRDQLRFFFGDHAVTAWQATPSVITGR